MVLVDGFTVLRLPLAKGSPHIRNVLAKKHTKTQDDPWPANRTLFLTSLDDFQTEATLKKAFSIFGAIEEVHLKRLDKDGITVILGHIVFLHLGCVDKVLTDETLWSECVLPLPSAGRKKWNAETAKKIRDPDELQREIDTWMASYEAREAEK